MFVRQVFCDHVTSSTSPTLPSTALYPHLHGTTRRRPEQKRWGTGRVVGVETCDQHVLPSSHFFQSCPSPVLFHTLTLNPHPALPINPRVSPSPHPKSHFLRSNKSPLQRNARRPKKRQSVVSLETTATLSFAASHARRILGLPTRSSLLQLLFSAQYSVNFRPMKQPRPSHK